MKKITSPKQLEELRKTLLNKKAPDKPRIIVSAKATCCYLKGSQEVVEALEQQIKNKGLEGKVELVTTGCLGFCQLEPIILIQPAGIFYPSVDASSISKIFTKDILNGEICEDLLYTDPATGKKIPYEKEIPFYRKQRRLVLGDSVKIDPTSIDDYIVIGGYSGLSKALNDLSPETIIAEIKSSGLSGRGGAGFPTGIKWENTRNRPGNTKYVICNADEGDPGAYMDRSILESNPHSVVEGMIIGAYAIGASEGWIYVRNEYPLAVKHISLAIEKAGELGLLGENILNSGFNFNIKIAKGAGAFVCGEETALIASIEGKRGVPRQKPPFPSQSGLFGKPTNINNVETLANVPIIVTKGSNWFAGIGTKASKGTKIFSLVGNVQNTGLVEVPMGTTLREVVYDIGGGAPNGKKVKAVQIGGPSGGCIPEELFHLPIDYQSLTGAGAIMGSGGMIVMDEDTCMVDVAKYFTDFLQKESCGKCVTCREGIQRMYEILTNISAGNGREEDLGLLEELAKVVKDGSLCGLGQTAPNPVLSLLRYFRSEFLVHIKEKNCPAGVCKAIIKYRIEVEKCTGCGLCKKKCPQLAIEGESKQSYAIIQDKCTKCGICSDVCKFYAVVKSGGGIVKCLN
jgi:NADH:ubiquinone oxidoreductase subunit F (NADH-binding)/(2Fe-2S) ferredoxin/Pyruvate/2-oxoacid:ferredoxin oxidoreductase delta subunit